MNTIPPKGMASGQIIPQYTSVMAKFGTSKLDLYNRNGDRICDAFGCRKHTKLESYRGGIFCKIHRAHIDLIRSDIDHSDSHEELIARDEEIRFRKTFDPGHVYYANKLRAYLSDRTTSPLNLDADDE